MEKIEFIPNRIEPVVKEVIDKYNFDLPQCRESKWVQFLNFFKRKKKIVTWVDLEKELSKFLKECKIDLDHCIYSGSTFNLSVENTKKFIKKFNKYQSSYYELYSKSLAKIKITNKDIGKNISFLFFGNSIYINIIK
jgi:hypothetical protein